jgi:hypothetical protein
MSRIVIVILGDFTCLFTYLTMISQMCFLNIGDVLNTRIGDELGIAWKTMSMTCALSTPFG